MVTKRRFAAAILAALVLVALTASLFIVVHAAHHDCSGDDCPVCAAAAVCRDTLKTLSGALAVFAAVASVCFAVILITSYIASLRIETPVSLKVKLLN